MEQQQKERTSCDASAFHRQMIIEEVEKVMRIRARERHSHRILTKKVTRLMKLNSKRLKSFYSVNMTGITGSSESTDCQFDLSMDPPKQDILDLPQLFDLVHRSNILHYLRETEVRKKITITGDNALVTLSSVKHCSSGACIFPSSSNVSRNDLAFLNVHEMSSQVTSSNNPVLNSGKYNNLVMLFRKLAYSPSLKSKCSCAKRLILQRDNLLTAFVHSWFEELDSILDGRRKCIQKLEEEGLAIRHMYKYMPRLKRRWAYYGHPRRGYFHRFTMFNSDLYTHMMKYLSNSVKSINPDSQDSIRMAGTFTQPSSPNEERVHSSLDDPPSTVQTRRSSVTDLYEELGLNSFLTRDNQCVTAENQQLLNESFIPSQSIDQTETFSQSTLLRAQPLRPLQRNNSDDNRMDTVERICQFVSTPRSSHSLEDALTCGGRGGGGGTITTITGDRLRFSRLTSDQIDWATYGDDASKRKINQQSRNTSKTAKTRKVPSRKNRNLQNKKDDNDNKVIKSSIFTGPQFASVTREDSQVNPFMDIPGQSSLPDDNVITLPITDDSQSKCNYQPPQMQSIHIRPRRICVPLNSSLPISQKPHLSSIEDMNQRLTIQDLQRIFKGYYALQDSKNSRYLNTNQKFMSTDESTATTLNSPTIGRHSPPGGFRSIPVDPSHSPSTLNSIHKCNIGSTNKPQATALFPFNSEQNMLPLLPSCSPPVSCELLHEIEDDRCWSNVRPLTSTMTELSLGNKATLPSNFCCSSDTTVDMAKLNLDDHNELKDTITNYPYYGDNELSADILDLTENASKALSIATSTIATETYLKKDTAGSATTTATSASFKCFDRVDERTTVKDYISTQPPHSPYTAIDFTLNRVVDESVTSYSIPNTVSTTTRKDLLFSSDVTSGFQVATDLRHSGYHDVKLDDNYTEQRKRRVHPDDDMKENDVSVVVPTTTSVPTLPELIFNPLSLSMTCIEEAKRHEGKRKKTNPNKIPIFAKTTDSRCISSMMKSRKLPLAELFSGQTVDKRRHDRSTT